MRSLDEEWNLLPLSDIHYGNPGHDEKAFRAAIKRVKDNPNYLTIGMGDYVENNSVISRNMISKTYDEEQSLESNAPLVSQQVRKFRELWAPISDKTIGMILGNHEDRTINHDMFKLLFTEPLNVPYLGDLSFIQLRFMFRKKVVRDYVILATHSRFGGQMSGSVMNAAQRAINAYDCDLVLFGHTHFSFVGKMKRKYLDKSCKLQEKKIIIGNTGSFLDSHVKGFNAYTDKKLGSLRDVGTITITFRPKDGDMFAHE